jgi:hypothetical protein
MTESGDLGGFDALGKAGGLRFDGGVGAEGAGGGGVGDVDGGFRGVVAAGEKSGEKASEAQRGNFKEVAFGT